MAKYGPTGPRSTKSSASVDGETPNAASVPIKVGRMYREEDVQ